MSTLDQCSPALVLPRRSVGRQSAQSIAAYRKQIEAFSKLIKQIRSTMDFSVGSRGWCYILERHGLRKGEFDLAQTVITDCRKSGDLPLDICDDDASRESIGVEKLNKNNIDDEVESWINYLRDHAHKRYTPISFWADLGVYVEVATEKLDLRNLFEPVCTEFRVPITNFKGWSDLNSRAAIMKRCAAHEAAGRQCVLLLCGDHDPAGLYITEMMRTNLEDLSRAVSLEIGHDWSPDNLIIIRFGLNDKFIDRHNLTWIDNLETSSGGNLADKNHRDHDKDYVQSYIRQFGVRKCEANALVVEPAIGRQLCRNAILNHVPASAPADHERKLNRIRERLRRALRRRVA
jgi:hypothetical protein